MEQHTVRANGQLLLAAALWGFAFVAQRVGMQYVGPFLFNGVRFALGSLSLIPLLMITRRKEELAGTISHRLAFGGGLLAGMVLFVAASLQQVGIIYTTAGKAGFITGLYVILVPILGLLVGQRSNTTTWGGAMLATLGLYLLSVTGQLTISRGDLLVLIGACFWACHVHIISWFSARMNTIRLAFSQFVVCSILSLITAAFTETIAFEALLRATVLILYGGLVSVGVAYTLQVVAQRYAHPTHAAIILSLETVFAAFGGWLLLGETFSARGLVGCALMLAGMLLSQVRR